MPLINSNTLNEWAMGIPQRARGLLAEIKDAPRQIGLLFDPKFQKGLLDQRSVTDTFNKSKAEQLAMDLITTTPAGGIAGTFIGKGAKTWNTAANAKAMQMAEKGVDPRTIWKETGNWKAPDGMWRQEIPDNAAFYRGSQAAGSSYSDDVMLHPELYGNYPHLKGKRVVESPHAGGSYDEATGQITVGPTNANSTMLHELQHAIQQREGWAKGGSPKEMAQEYGLARSRLHFLEREPDYQQGMKELDDMWDAVFNKGTMSDAEAIAKEAEIVKKYPSIAESRKVMDILRQSDEYGFDSYRRLAGEAEARATQARMSMDMAQRLNTFPEDSYDVPISQLIIRGLLER